ncbi:MAG: hypothetical protein ACE5K0_09220 [Candidatus Methanofastidiosia archaeon]
MTIINFYQDKSFGKTLNCVFQFFFHGGKETDRIPANLWQPHPRDDHVAERLAKVTMKYCKKYDLDLIWLHKLLEIVKFPAVRKTFGFS